MGVLFVYILKATICLALFYLFYRLLLSRETFHRFNRIALLSILLLSLLIPLMEVTTTQQTEVNQTLLTLEQLLMMADAQGSGTTVTPTEEVTVSGIQAGLLLYLVGVLFFVFRNFFSLFRLVMLLRSGKREKMDHGIVLVTHPKAAAPFSWMKYIVISEKDLEENGREILIHERAHIRNRHSIDLLVADVCIFFQWFNPAAWLLKQELQNIHEYEADETVIKEGVDAKQYQLLLIKKAVGTRLYSMANSFNHSKLKKRITMMLKEKSSPWARLKYLYILPLAAIAVTAFARPEISEKAEVISAVKVNDLAAIVEVKVAENLPKAMVDTSKTVVKRHEEVFSRVEQMPDFPGGVSALMQFVKENVKYPAKAKAAGTQGRVIVEFVVDRSGKVTAPKVVRSIDAELDKEAIRLVESMPNWIPGKRQGKEVAVKYTVPIVFRLGSNDNEAATTTTAIRMQSNGEKNPLIIIDGERVSNAIMSAMDPSRFESITVLKDASSTAIYGDQAKNGVIVITLKPDKKHMSAQDENAISIVGKANETFYTPTEVNKISGLVKATDGSPVVGALVLIEGTTNGTITDKSGAFTLDTPKDATLIVSYVDMSTEKVKAASKVTIVLKKK